MLFPTNNIITHGDKHWIYYGGVNERHPSERGPNFKRDNGLGLAQLRLDGFVALSAHEKPGWIVTKPFRLEGKQLELNVDAGGPGSVRIEVLDASCKPMPAFAGDNATEYRGVDSVRHRTTWKDHTDLENLVGQVVRLRIRLENARLYAFQVRQ
jgi:hypothetical protein